MQFFLQEGPESLAADAPDGPDAPGAQANDEAPLPPEVHLDASDRRRDYILGTLGATTPVSMENGGLKALCQRIGVFTKGLYVVVWGSSF